MRRPESSGAERRRHAAALRSAGAAVALCLVLTGCTAGAVEAPTSPTPRASTATPTPMTAPEAAQAVPASPPASVGVPAIGLDEPLIDLGISAEGDLEVPEDFDDVGWFTGGGRPGGHGPTVIAAHVDSPTGPAVFIDLHRLVIGDMVHLTDADGEVFRYAVTEVASYPKSAFPTARVFGAVAGDEVRLITCDGVFDRDAGSYRDNLVVYAAAVQG